MPNTAKKETKKPLMSIEVKDFGPIAGGSVTLRPLTVFVGPNNSGKSYAAMLIYTLRSSFVEFLPWHFIDRLIPYRRGEKFDIPSLRSIRRQLRQQLKDLKEGTELSVPEPLVAKASQEILKAIYEEALNDEISHSFASQVGDLIRIGRRAFGLQVSFDSVHIHLACQRNGLQIKKYPKVSGTLVISIAGERSPRDVEVVTTTNKTSVLLRRSLLKSPDYPIIEWILRDVLLNRLSHLIPATPCHYLPAARSGILQGHRVLAAGIVRTAASTENFKIPRFAGVVSDFMSSLLTLPDKKGPFYQLAQAFEQELIHGEILRTRDEYVYPEIKYLFQGKEIPLNRASSSVSELAPFFLYLKYIVRRENMLIIEEPETHLHPENQRILAKYLVKLMKGGVHVVITTHSEFLIEQLSNFIMLGSVKKKGQYDYDESAVLRRDEIGVYVFQYDSESGGYRVRELEVSDEDGIPQEEFLRIHEALYEETIRLRQDLESQS